MIILKKIIGNQARKMSDKSQNFESLNVHMKKVHGKETHAIYELHAKLLNNGKAFAASHENRNLFIAIDNALKSVEKQIK